MNRYWVDNLSPWIWRIHGDFGIRWYGLAYALGFCSARLIGGWLINRGRLRLTNEECTEAVLYAAVFGILCARLFDFLLYDFRLLYEHPIAFWSFGAGGMSSFGGIVGVFTGLWIFCLRKSLSCWTLFDLAAISGPIGIFAGRIANFVNGELWGRPTYVRWAVIFPSAPPVTGINVPRHPSQIYAALLEGVAVFVVVWLVFRKRPPPGVALGFTLSCYATARFIDEFWREPEPSTLIAGWMTLNQLLTIPLFLLGLALIYRRAIANPLG